MTTTETGLNVQLFQDLKQKYPEVAEHVITLCVIQNKNDRKKCIEALDGEPPNPFFGNDQYLPNRLQDMHITDQRTRSDSALSGISSASTSSSSSHKIPSEYRPPPMEPSFTSDFNQYVKNPGNCIQNIECRVASPSPQIKTYNVPQGIRQIPVQHFQTIRSPQEKPSGSCSQNPLVYNILYQQGDNRLPPSSHTVGHPNYINQHGNINYSLQRSPITSQASMNQGPPVAPRSFSVQPLVEHGQLNIIRLQPGDRTPVYQPGNYNPSGLHGSHSEPYLTGMDNGTTPCNNYYTPLVVNVGTPPIEDVAKLREVNRRLQTDIQVMTREIDNYNNGLLPLGVCDPTALEQQNFSQNMNPGQRGSIFAVPHPDPPTSDSPPPPLPPRRIHAIPPAPHQQPPTGSGDSDGDGKQWSCSACILLNHPALNKCECCEMPRINSSPPSIGSFLQTPSFCDGIYINCFKHLDEKRCITNVQDKGSLFTTSLLCDGISVDCIADKRLDDRTFIKSVKDKDINCLLSNLNLQKSDEFTCLFSVWHFFKDKGLLDSKSIEQLLKHAVCNGQSLMCRLVLTFFKDILKPNPFLTKILILALVNEEKECAKAISWFIVRAFYLQYKFAIIESPVEDIWPALRCMRSHCINRLPFLEDVVIVVELGNDRPNLPDEFCQLKIMFMTKDDSSSSELDNSPFQNRNEASFSHENVTVSGIDAKDLFTQHSKLTLICKSFITIVKKDSEHYFQPVPYVKLYCRAKGYIPIGEDHFPRKVRGMPTDILQGTPSLMANLKVGNTIGTDINKKGTLGGFVKVRGDICFLTCLHVFLSVEDLASDNISLDDDQWIKVKCYFPRSATNDQQIKSYECGRIRDIAFEVDNERETSIDAALVTLNDGIRIDENDYLESRIGQSFPYSLLGMKSMYLNENSVDFKSLCYSLPPPTVEIVAVGAISGLITSKVLVNENDEKDIDLEPIDQTFSTVVLSEVKDKVTRVIQKLKGIHASNFISSDNILTAIEEVCDANISKEVKLIIADITNNILSKTVENTHDNMDTNTNNIQEGITFQETYGSAYLQTSMCVDDIIDQIIISKATSSLSTITSDVHMQHTCLQKTGDRLTKKRTSRRMYNQIHVSNIPFQPGDSGTCIYTKTPIQGCLGMAIANHPEGGCIATPIKEILKHFKIKIR